MSHQAVDAASSGANRAAGAVQDIKKRTTGSASSAGTYVADTTQSPRKSTVDSVSHISGHVSGAGKDVKNHVPGSAPSTGLNGTTSNPSHYEADHAATVAATPLGQGFDKTGQNNRQAHVYPVDLNPVTTRS